jgi:hypothetical protein
METRVSEKQTGSREKRKGKGSYQDTFKRIRAEASSTRIVGFLSTDLPEGSLNISPEEQEEITKWVKRVTKKGKKRFEKNISWLKKQGYTKEEIEYMLD